MELMVVHPGNDQHAHYAGHGKQTLSGDKIQAVAVFAVGQRIAGGIQANEAHCQQQQGQRHKGGIYTAHLLPLFGGFLLGQGDLKDIGICLFRFGVPLVPCHDVHLLWA